MRDLDKFLDEVLLKSDNRTCAMVEKALSDHCLVVVSRHKLRHLDELMKEWKESIDK